MNAILEGAISALLSLIKAGHACVLTASGGKDSTLTTLLGLEAIRRAKLEGVPQARHYVSSADTTIENPAMVNHLDIMHAEIRAFCAREELPVEIRIAQPTLAAQFVVSTIGRGTLVRTPENGVKDGVKKRPCSDAWKVQPQTKMAKELEAEVLAQGFKEPVVVLGSRRAESAARAESMVTHNASAIEATGNAVGSLTICPIGEFSTDDVWEALGMFNNPSVPAPWPSFTDGRSITRMLDLYRDGGDGQCGVLQGETGGNKSACGSRFGCSFCCVSGVEDKSMSSMIKEPQHAHLAGLNRFRNLLIRKQWDMGTRELVGRTLSPAGYLRVQPDVYSMKHRLDLLGMLLTLDVLEQERAEQHEADLWSGKIPDTPENQELANIQFQMINPQQLVAIDFQLSLHHYAPHAFPAIAKWHEVYEGGRRYAVPEVPALQKVDIDCAGWFKVGAAFDCEVPTDGLRSYIDEMWNRYRHPERPSVYAQTANGERVTWFEEDDEMTVDATAACSFVTCVFDLQYLLDAQQHPAIESARFWLNEGILKLAKGTAWKYQEMAKRGQYFAHLADKLNVTPKELDQHLVRNAISDAEHAALVAVAPAADGQTNLFQAAA